MQQLRSKDSCLPSEHKFRLVSKLKDVSVVVDNGKPTWCTCGRDNLCLKFYHKPPLFRRGGSTYCCVTDMSMLAYWPAVEVSEALDVPKEYQDPPTFIQINCEICKVSVSGGPNWKEHIYGSFHLRNCFCLDRKAFCNICTEYFHGHTLSEHVYEKHFDCTRCEGHFSKAERKGSNDRPICSSCHAGNYCPTHKAMYKNRHGMCPDCFKEKNGKDYSEDMHWKSDVSDIVNPVRLRKVTNLIDMSERMRDTFACFGMGADSVMLEGIYYQMQERYPCNELQKALHYQSPKNIFDCLYLRFMFLKSKGERLIYDYFPASGFLTDTFTKDHVSDLEQAYRDTNLPWYRLAPGYLHQLPEIGIDVLSDKNFTDFETKKKDRIAYILEHGAKTGLTPKKLSLYLEHHLK